jgi:hypothetical protein
MTGGGAAGASEVAKVLLVDVAAAPPPLVDNTAKSYAVEALSPVNVTECDVTSVLTSADCDPYPVVVPYETCELEGWSVVQVIVAVVEVIPVVVTALMTGGGPPARVAKVELADAAAFPEASVDSAA